MAVTEFGGDPRMEAIRRRLRAQQKKRKQLEDQRKPDRKYGAKSPSRGAKDAFYRGKHGLGKTQPGRTYNA